MRGCPGFGACAGVCPADALQVVGRRMSVPAVMDAVRADLPFYEESGGGVTFTGGEPLAQPEFILGLLEACRAEGVRSALDTSGFASRDLVVRAGTLADIVPFDLKLLDDGRHRAATGVSNAPILANLAALYEAGAHVLLRLPLIPGINDAPADLEQMARYIASLAAAAGPQRAHILPITVRRRGNTVCGGKNTRWATPPSPRRRPAQGRRNFRGGRHIGDDWRLTPLLEVAMNERIRRLREESFNAKPSFSAERALLTTEFYKAWYGRVSMPVLRAMNFYNLCEKKTLYIGPDELIVGERGPRPKAASSFPELTCHSEEDLRILNSRPMTSYSVSEEDMEIYRTTVIPYWRGRSMRDRAFAEIPQAWKDLYEAGLFTEFMEAEGTGPHGPRRIDLPQGDERPARRDRRRAGPPSTGGKTPMPSPGMKSSRPWTSHAGPPYSSQSAMRSSPMRWRPTNPTQGAPRN